MIHVFQSNYASEQVRVSAAISGSKVLPIQLENWFLMHQFKQLNLLENFYTYVDT